MSILSKPYFHDEAKAYAYLESVLWPSSPICPHCGSVEKVYRLEGVKSKPSKKNPEGKERFGLKKCGACREQFTVTVGTVYESSHIPLHKWLQATYLMCASKKGISAHQIHRALEITYKSAWFMCHRIREAMRDGKDVEPVGSQGQHVEVDETYIGRKAGVKKTRGWRHKEAVMSLVERGGKVRSHHVPNVKADTLRPILMAQISRNAILMTDEASQYKKLGAEFKEHKVVQHSLEEYVRGDAYTNTIEGYFSIFKRGMKGIYQHCSSKHLKRYLCEFDFRYNERGVEDTVRADVALSGAVGKRLLYRDSSVV